MIVRWRSVLLKAVFPVLGLMLVATSASASLPIFDSQGKQLPSLAPLVKEVSPAVVNIRTFTTQPVYENPLLNDPFFRRFFNIPRQQQMPHSRRAEAAGSGVIIDAKKGTVITNYHVIRGADEIRVSLNDGRTYKAKLLGSDPDMDIAVLKLKKFDHLTQVKLGDSDKLQVGDFVIAIGNPFALGQTVTSGVVSALGRSGLGIEGYEDFIQTDASINPGNSGGALVNLRGELVGINTAIIAPAGGNVGIGFAIPINMAKSSIEQILKHGEVRRGQLGIIIQNLTPDLADAFGIDHQQRGVVIAQVQDHSEAQKSGLKAGDVIISIDGQAVDTASQLRNAVGQRRIGDTVKLTILRDNKTKVVKVKVGKATGGTLAASGSIHKFLEGAQLKADDHIKGVEIVSIAPGSPAADAGLRPGDVILSANRVEVSTVDELNKAAAKSQQRLVLRIKRGNAALFMVLQ